MAEIAERFKNILFRAGATPEEFEHCAPEIRRANRRRLIFYLGVACVIFSVMTLLACLYPILSHNFPVYVVSLILCLGLLVTVATYPGENDTLLSFCIFVFEAVLYVMAIIIGTINSKTGQSTTFIVMMMVVPLMFTLRPLRNIFRTALFVGIFVICVHTFKNGENGQMDIINGLVFAVISMMLSTNFMVMMMENAISRSKLFSAAERDINTALQNRNAYERRLHEYPMHCTNTLSCVYVDVNGLHELNNSKGHAEGDKMLRIVAQKLRDEFGPDDCYRVGGDEFVAFVVDESLEQMRRRISKFMMDVEMAGYSVAVGTATHSAGGVDVDVLVKTAEQRMYMAKAEHYRTSTARPESGEGHR